MRSFFFSASLMACLGLAQAALPFYGNQSSIRWQSASTEHFHYHYPLEYADHAAQIGAFAEAVHDSLVRRYHSELPGKVDLVIRNSLFSNGQASPVYNMMNVWLTDWDLRLRGTHNWMRDVVTHEFSHLVSIESGSKLPPFMHGLQVSYQDYSNERVQSHAMGIVPFMLQPLWFAEGTAQYESSRMGFDAWDTHRDMLLRVASLEEDLLPLTYMHDFPEDALGGERGPYNQGFSLVRYIAETYGDGAIPALWAELRRTHRVTMDGALRQTLGISEEALYTQWKNATLARYQARRAGLGTLRTGVKLSREASYQDMPVVAGNYLYGVSNFGGPGLEGDLFRLPLRRDTLSGENKPDSAGSLELSHFAYDAFRAQKAYFGQGLSLRLDSAAGPLLAYVTYRNRDRSGKAYFDIMVSDTLGRERPVTRLADAVYPDLSFDSKQVVFARREADGTRFHLSRAAVGDVDGKAQDYVDVYSPPDSVRYFGIYTPRWSPDGKRIAFSFFDGTRRQVAVVDVDGKNLKLVAGGAFDARDPAWSPDGAFLYYSSDQSGIFDLYRYTLADASVLRLSRVIGGAFQPVAAGADLYYIGYDKDGFSLYHLPADSLKAPLAASPEAYADAAAPPRPLEVLPIEFAGMQRPYRPIPRLPIVVPLISIEERAPDFGAVSQGVAVPKGGILLGVQDPLQKNFLQMALLLELGKGVDFIGENGLDPSKQSEFMALLENRSTPLTANLGYVRRNIAGQDTVRYEDARSHDDSLSLSHYAVAVNALQAGAGYSPFKKGDSLGVDAGYDWAAFNLYQDGFAWDYHKRLSVGSFVSWSGGLPLEGSNAQGAGHGAIVAYRHSRTELFRPGTFANSFTISSSGVVSPHYRDYALNEASLSLYGSLPNPLHGGARLAAGLRASGVLSWSGQDTLDAFYKYPLALDGYPLLRNSENYTRSGEHVAVAQLHYLFPLYNDWRHSAWIFATRDLYLDLYAQAGNAWNGKGLSGEAREWSRWDRSLGVEWRWANRIFYTYPLDVSLKLSRGLDRVEGAEGYRRLHPVDVPLLPSVVSPTTVQFRIGMGFSNSWMGAH